MMFGRPWVGMAERGRGRSRLAIQGAFNGQAAAVKDVGVDHGGLDVLVAEQLLDGADVVAALEQVGGIEWKGSALHPRGRTFLPSPLRTGQAIFTASGSPT